MENLGTKCRGNQEKMSEMSETNPSRGFFGLKEYFIAETNEAWMEENSAAF